MPGLPFDLEQPPAEPPPGCRDPERWRSAYRELGDHYNEGDTIARLGDTHHAAGNPQDARDAWQQALTILNDLDHPNADIVRTKLAGLDPPTDETAG